jgi:hypothetical protein
MKLSKGLPDLVICERKLIGNAESLVAICYRLPYLFKALNSDAIIAAYISQLESNLNQQDLIAIKSLKDALQWIEEKLDLLKTSKFINDSYHKDLIEKVERRLRFEEFSLGSTYFECVFSAFRRTANAISIYGENHLFDGWYRIDNQEPFIFPVFVELQLKKGSKTLQNWKEQLYSNPVVLFAYLKMLSQDINSYQPIKIPLVKQITSLEEMEAIYVKVNEEFILSDLSNPTSSIHPNSCEQFCRLIDTFLNMIEVYILQPKKDERPNKSQAKAFIKNQIKGLLNKYEGKELETFIKIKNSKIMCQDIYNIARMRNEAFLNELTDSLIKSIYRSCLKEMGIKRKGGAPEKNLV